jgi:hypothetical protein
MKKDASTLSNSVHERHPL